MATRWPVPLTAPILVVYLLYTTLAQNWDAILLSTGRCLFEFSICSRNFVTSRTDYRPRAATACLAHSPTSELTAWPRLKRTQCATWPSVVDHTRPVNARTCSLIVNPT